jgi:hypothetical protein
VKAVLVKRFMALPDRRMSASDVWNVVRWWTRATIAEALDEMASVPAFGVHCQHTGQGKRYAAVDFNGRVG